MKFYLINPKFPDTFWGFHHIRDIGGYRYAMANLALPTLAAMIPPEHEVKLGDENVEPVDWKSDADLIGITGFNLQSPRMFAIAEEFRRRGKKVAIGGPYASLCPEECRNHADILFVGECEQIFPKFISEFERGRFQDRYEEPEKVDLTTSPTPRWDLLNYKHYGRVPVQTTRGCPFNCEFCDVIVYLGRKVRQKTTEQITTELEALYPHLYRSGRNSVFFADDNFIGNLAHARKTCQALIEFNKSHPRPLRFSTQVTINLAKQTDLLELMVDAGFHSLFFGIETPDKETLLGANKVQNTKGDLLEDIQTVQSYGIFVWAGMIVGFDNDRQDVFQSQLEFMNRSNIPISMTGMLNAPANTPLWHRLKKEGRLLEGHQYTDQADTNIIPKSMSLQQLREGYADLLEQLYSYENYTERVIGSIEAIRYTPKKLKKSFSLPSAIYNFTRLAKMLRYFLLTGEKKRRDAFVRVVKTLARRNQHYLKEGLWHLAVHKHFYEYSRIIAAQIRGSETEQEMKPECVA